MAARCVFFRAYRRAPYGLLQGTYVLTSTEILRTGFYERTTYGFRHYGGEGLGGGLTVAGTVVVQPEAAAPAVAAARPAVPEAPKPCSVGNNKMTISSL